MGMINILDAKGHTTIEWDVANAEATAIAEKKFNELAQTHHALFETRGGVATEEGKVRYFNPEAEEYIAVRGFQGG